MLKPSRWKSSTVSSSTGSPKKSSWISVWVRVAGRVLIAGDEAIVNVAVVVEMEICVME